MMEAKRSIHLTALPVTLTHPMRWLSHCFDFRDPGKQASAPLSSWRLTGGARLQSEHDRTSRGSFQFFQNACREPVA